MQPLYTTDLAGLWEFTPEGDQISTTIRVPGGGWLKQGFDCEAGSYRTRLTIPDLGRPQAVRLELGAVNHQAACYLGPDQHTLRLIHEEVTAFTPQIIDLTPHVQPGASYALRLDVRAWRDGRPIAPHWAEWCECIARGILREAALRVYPDLFLSDVAVRASTARRTLSADVWLTNTSARDRVVRLSGHCSSWNGADWPYPALPELPVTVLAGQTCRVRLDDLSWMAGPESYWWPNMPYRPGYRAQLHLLHLTLMEDAPDTGAAPRAKATPLHTASVRFGFREFRQEGARFTLNGVPINLRGDNLQVANYDRIDHGGRGDAIDTLPGFLPPSEGNPGWPQAVDNFLRLNYNVQRTHMGPWTPYMLDVCDERGLMLIGESACRWNGFDMEDGRGFYEEKCLQDIIRRDRNHPAIVRWSAKNEPQCADEAYHLGLYRAIQALDDTRPISEDIVVDNRQAYDVDRVYRTLKQQPDFTWIEHYLTYDDQGQPYFTPLEHNDALIPLPDRPYGLGEADWMRSSTPVGLTWFATTVALARAQGASDVRPYVLLSSWASSIPGVRTTDFLTEENRRPLYGEDNLPDPWQHPAIRLLQRAYHPHLALDVDFWRLNRRGDPWGHFPTQAPPIPADADVTRAITLFNDTLADAPLELCWELREGSPVNRLGQQGRVARALAPGERADLPISFHTPTFNTHLFLTLRVLRNGAELFRDDLTAYEVVGGGPFRPL